MQSSMRASLPYNEALTEVFWSLKSKYRPYGSIGLKWSSITAVSTVGCMLSGRVKEVHSWMR